MSNHFNIRNYTNKLENRKDNKKEQKYILKPSNGSQPMIIKKYKKVNSNKFFPKYQKKPSNTLYKIPLEMKNKFKNKLNISMNMIKINKSKEKRRKKSRQS